MGNGKDQLWTDGELSVLRDWYDRAGSNPVNLKLLSSLLGRPVTGICRKAKSLGLTKQTGRSRGDDVKVAISKAAKARILRDGHPRGMLGKTHTPELKQEMSKITRGRWASMAPDERQKILDASYSARKRNGTLVPPKVGRGSWKAGWREIGGKRNYFRSRWEANYARYLQFLKEKGEISEWEHEPETFWFEAIKRGVRSYKPDFRVTFNDGRVEWHEVKGWMDSRSRTTIKRMRKYYPGETLIIIDKDQYQSIKLSAGIFIRGWE